MHDSQSSHLVDAGGGELLSDGAYRTCSGDAAARRCCCRGLDS